jgi:3-deoxy-manno-octulosonate cytidylyltransferase (CMP-KDO synthetase)
VREKPLRLLGGEPLIRHVVQNVLAWGFDAPVVVATDDIRVVEAVAFLNVESALSHTEHHSGTSRVAEVVASPGFREAEVVLNVQGDQPFVTRELVQAVLECVEGGEEIATAGVPLAPDAVTDPSRVKVVVDGSARCALRFSRSLPASAAWSCDVDVLEHVGLYAYTRRALERWVGLSPDAAEKSEGLEQLRPLAHGISIGVAPCAAPAPISIDTEHDLLRAQEYMTFVGHGGS